MNAVIDMGNSPPCVDFELRSCYARAPGNWRGVVRSDPTLTEFYSSQQLAARISTELISMHENNALM